MDIVQFNHKRLGDVGVSSIIGRLDAETAELVKKTVFDSIDSGSDKLLLNLDGVDYVSSAGLRVLLQISRKIDQKKGRFVLFAITKPVKEVLKISGLNEYFSLAESESEAYNLATIV